MDSQTKTIYDEITRRYNEKTAKIVIENIEVKKVIKEIVDIMKEYGGKKVTRDVYNNINATIRRRREKMTKIVKKTCRRRV